MKTPSLLLLGAALVGTSLTAQETQVAAATPTTPAATDSSAKPAEGARKESATSALGTMQPIVLQYFRPVDKRAINTFETRKEAGRAYDGFRIQFDAAFTQQFQGLGHSNTAAPKVVNNVNANQLITMGHGFNNAVANLYVNAQLAKGVRVAMTSYLSARHHNETWVKDGYLQVDDSPIDLAPLNALMKYVTIKAGHFEVNYGDTHFRRTDNGNAVFNPLVGNYILDAFAPQVGAEVYVQSRGVLLMGGVTNGEEKGMVLNAAKRAPAFLAKVAVDRQLTSDFRARLSGSVYSQSKSANQVLFSGDRAGSRYYDVLENTTSTEAAQAWSGAVQPFSGPNAGLRSAVVNPFLKYRGLEYYGNFERASGRGATETADRKITQVANELTYRALADKVYLSGRYNTVSGKLAGIANDISVERTQVGGGWFVTPLVLTKLEWVNQKYYDFPTNDIRNGGQFKGFMIEGVVAF